MTKNNELEVTATKSTKSNNKVRVIIQIEDDKDKEINPLVEKQVRQIAHYLSEKLYSIIIRHPDESPVIKAKEIGKIAFVLNLIRP